MSSESPVEPGQILADKFRVERVLGVGGMGVVVEATHLALKQRVALKFLLPDALADKGAVARFEREARAAVQLRSEHVVKVMDVGRMPDGAPFMVMEYLEGETLGRVIKEHGRLPVPVVLNYLLQMCEAVSEAHRLGIVHRDLKPDNIFVTTDVSGEPLVKVLDFGISKVSGEQMSLTNTTQVLGSPYYMSPEQLRASRDVDQRSDVWAIGAILYEMLTGRVPFEATTIMELCTAVLESTPPPITDFRDDVPAEMVAVVDACLAKQRDDRLASVAEIVRRLGPPPGQTGRYLLPPPDGVPRPRPSDGAGASARGISGGTATSWDAMGVSSKRKKSPWIIGGALVAVGLAASIGGFLAFTHPAVEVATPVPPQPLATSAPTPSSLTTSVPAPSATQASTTEAPSATASAAASAAPSPFASGKARPGHADAAAPSASTAASVAAPEPTGPVDDIPNVR